jgi:hypothetical protein
LRLALRGTERRRVARVRYFANGRAVGPARRAPFRALVSSRRLQAGRRATIRALVRMVDGRVATYDLPVEGCFV